MACGHIAVENEKKVKNYSILAQSLQLALWMVAIGYCRYFLLFKLWIYMISGIGSWTISSPHFFLTYRHEWSSKNTLSKKDFGLYCYFFGILTTFWPCDFRPFLTNWDADIAQIHPYPIKLVFALLDQFTLTWIPLLHQ